MSCFDVLSLIVPLTGVCVRVCVCVSVPFQPSPTFLSFNIALVMNPEPGSRQKTRDGKMNRVEVYLRSPSHRRRGEIRRVVANVGFPSQRTHDFHSRCLPLTNKHVCFPSLLNFHHAPVCVLVTPGFCDFCNEFQAAAGGRWADTINYTLLGFNDGK